MAAVDVLRPMAAVTVVVTVLVTLADRAHAAKVPTVVTVQIAHRAKTEAASSSRQATEPMPTHHAHLRAKAAVVAWGSPADFPVNRAHLAHPQASPTRCAPASI
jgi:hypothetical protein